MKFDSKEIAVAVTLYKNGATLEEIEAALGWPASCKGAKARDCLKAAQGLVRDVDRGSPTFGKYVRPS